MAKASGDGQGAAAAARQELLQGPILKTILRLALPNTMSVTAASAVAILETVYVGALGTEQLAAIALVFPFTLLMTMMSGGAIGGGIASAVSRALGGGDDVKAARLAFNAMVIGLGGGVLFTVVLEVFGPTFFGLLGGRGHVLDEATAFARVLFAGAIPVWLNNTFASIVRGTGNQRVPASNMLVIAVIQISVGGTLGLGLFGAPRLGMAGVACGQVAAYTIGVLWLTTYLFWRQDRVRLTRDRLRIDGAMLRDILRVGAVACFSPLQSVATVLIFTRLLAAFGTVALAGYGIGARLEFLLIPIAGAIGTAALPIVGMNVGAGQIARARRAAWYAGFLSAGMVGLVGLVVAVFPNAWAARFSTNEAVLAAAAQYLTIAGPAFGFLGFGLSIYFASLGSGKIVGPVLAQSGRLITVVVGGYALVVTSAPGWMMFGLVAASMVVYGSIAALSVIVTRWGNEAVPVLRPVPAVGRA